MITLRKMEGFSHYAVKRLSKPSFVTIKNITVGFPKGGGI